MTTTEIKTPTSKNITRRKMLQSFAVSSAATFTASIVPASAAPAFVAQELAAPELLELVEQHRLAWAAYGAALDAADSLHPSYGGAEAEAIVDILNDAEQEALQNVLTYPVATLADARAKAAHLTQNDYGLDQYDISALLASIADQNPQRATPSPSNLAFSNHHPVKLGIEELIAAITAETAAFRTAPKNDEGEAVTNAALDRVMAAKNRLLAVSKQDLTKGDGALATEVALALALLQRRWLVMEGDYQNENQRDECLLVDLLLQGTRFDDVPLLWHVDGKSRYSRPTDAELRVGWEVP